MILSLVKTELKKQIKDKGFFFWLLGMPILFIVLFSFIFGNEMNVTFHVNYIDQDHSETSERILSIIEDIEAFELVEWESLEEAQLDLQEGNISSIVVIPSDFEAEMMAGRENSLDFYYDAIKLDSVQPIQNLIENISYTFQEEKIQNFLNEVITDEAEKAAILEAPFKINTIGQQSEGMNAITQIVPGYTVMFTFFIIISMVNTFIKDREHGMLARLASTPLSKNQYLIGKWISFLIIVLAQVWVLLGFGYFVYDLYLGNIVALFILSLVLTFTTTGLGLAISLIAKSENFGIAITQVIALGGAMLGGLWFPIELMPSFIQKIALFIPQFWAQQAFQDIMLRDAGVADIWLSILILLGVGLVGVIVAAFSFKQFLRGAKS